MKLISGRSAMVLVPALFTAMAVSVHAAEFRAGAAKVDVTPLRFPVLVNGGMFSSTATKATSRIHARAIVLDDGAHRLAMVVVDSCMLPRPLLDEIKHAAERRTGLRADRILISATHTHTAPASMGCLGTDADPTYVPRLREGVVEAIANAERNLEPAQAGWAVGNAAEYTALRRWIIRPDRVALDPFGNPTVRANMHAGANWDNVTGESGPEDPDLSMIAFRSTSGRPIAVLANFSMHYFSGVEPVNADYFGLFCEGLQERVGLSTGTNHPPFVALMSHGCSGDIWRRDYTKPAPPKDQEWTIETYARGLLDVASTAFASIKYQSGCDIGMAEARMTLKYRVPDKQRLQWARQVVAAMGERAPRTTEEVYAREQILLHERQSTEIVVQALRIGDLGILTTPTETYALTGLKLKLQSPLPRTLVIELANGGDGYIPPPEQHLLGGYNTWPARSAGLEVGAEPRIVETALGLMEKVAGKPRRTHRQSRGPAVDSVLRARPAAYWRLDEFAAPWAMDASGHRCNAFYEPGVVFFLEGPRSSAFCRHGEVNRAAHFAGGRLQARLVSTGDRYSVSLWLWNGMPADGRETSGWLFGRGHDFGLDSNGEQVGVGGTASDPGKLIYQAGGAHSGGRIHTGRTVIPRWTWSHVVFVRDGGRVRIHLNGNPRPEIAVDAPLGAAPGSEQFFFGGRSDGVANWEGRLDEIAVFDRVLSEREVHALSAP